MLYAHQGKSPSVHATSHVAPTAVLCGDVTVGPNCSIGFGAVLNAESGPISIGANCVIMETAVLRGVHSHPLRLGNYIMVGPRAYLCGCTVDDQVFLATGATVFNGTRIGQGAEVRINGLVHINTVLPADATVPINWVAVGNPAEILPPEAHDRIWAIQKTLDFPGTVFGVDRPPPGQSMMTDVMPRYAGFLVKSHKGDEPV